MTPLITWGTMSRMARVSTSALDGLIRFMDRILHREPTFLVEVGTAYTTACWAVAILRPGPMTISPILDQSMHRFPEVAQGTIAAVIAANQVLAMGFGHVRWRAWASFATSIWLGWLSGAILSADATLAGGYVYAGMALVALLPFWRIFIEDDTLHNI